MHEYLMGTNLRNCEPFVLSDEDLSVHMAVLGQSGKGKSKFLELLMRYLIAAKRGFCLIDPHGDLSEDLLAYVAARRVEREEDDLIPRIHYLEPSYEQVFNYDPFKFRPSQPIPENLEENARRAWLAAKVDRVSEIVQRKQGRIDFEGQPRLQRILRNVLTAVGTAVGPGGRHLPMADALVLLDRDHPRHYDVFRLVAPHLDEDVLSDFNLLHTLGLGDFRAETESTVNRLRSLLSPVVKAIFCDQVETIDFHTIVQNGEILLVNLRETDYFSADQANAIGGLFIHEILSTAQNVHREQRKPFYMIVDEAGNFIGPDIERALGTMRKFLLSICLAAQDLSSFVRGESDLRQKVLSQCNSIVSFCQTWPEDLDILVRVMGTGNLDFAKHFEVRDRPDGYDFLPMKEFSESFSVQTNWSNGFVLTDSWQQGIGESWNRTEGIATGSTWNRGTATARNWSKSIAEGTNWSEGVSAGTNWSRGISETNQQSESFGENSSRSIQGTWQRSLAQQESHAFTDGTSEGRSRGENSSDGQTPLIKRGDVDKMITVRGSGETESSSKQRSESQTETESKTSTLSQGGGRTDACGRSHEHSSGYSYAESESEGGSLTKTETEGGSRTNTKTDGGSLTVNTGHGGSLTANVSEGKALSANQSEGGSAAKSGTDGGAESRSASVSRKLMPLARTREEVHETPSLLNAVQDQFEKMKQDFHALGRAEGIAKLRSRKDYLVFRTLTVEEQWEETDKWTVIDRMKEILSQRPYFSVPQMGQEAQKKRIDEFVKSVQRPKEEPKRGGLTPREKGPGSSFGI